MSRCRPTLTRRSCRSCCDSRLADQRRALPFFLAAVLRRARAAARPNTTAIAGRRVPRVAMGRSRHARSARRSMGRGARCAWCRASGAHRERAWRRRVGCGRCRPSPLAACRLLHGRSVRIGRGRPRAPGLHRARPPWPLPVPRDASRRRSATNASRGSSRSRRRSPAPRSSFTAACCRSACARSLGCRADSICASAIRSTCRDSR